MSVELGSLSVSNSTIRAGLVAIGLFFLFADLQCRSSRDYLRLFFFRLLRFFITASLTFGHRGAPLP